MRETAAEDSDAITFCDDLVLDIASLLFGWKDHHLDRSHDPELVSRFSQLKKDIFKSVKRPSADNVIDLATCSSDPRKTTAPPVLQDRD